MAINETKTHQKSFETTTTHKQTNETNNKQTKSTTKKTHNSNNKQSKIKQANKEHTRQTQT